MELSHTSRHSSFDDDLSSISGCDSDVPLTNETFEELESSLLSLCADLDDANENDVEASIYVQNSISDVTLGFTEAENGQPSTCHDAEDGQNQGLSTKVISGIGLSAPGNAPRSTISESEYNNLKCPSDLVSEHNLNIRGDLLPSTDIALRTDIIPNKSDSAECSSDLASERNFSAGSLPLPTCNPLVSSMLESKNKINAQTFCCNQDIVQDVLEKINFSNTSESQSRSHTKSFSQNQDNVQEDALEKTDACINLESQNRSNVKTFCPNKDIVQKDVLEKINSCATISAPRKSNLDCVLDENASQTDYSEAESETGTISVLSDLYDDFDSRKSDSDYIVVDIIDSDIPDDSTVVATDSCEEENKDDISTQYEWYIESHDAPVERTQCSTNIISQVPKQKIQPQWLERNANLVENDTLTLMVSDSEIEIVEADTVSKNSAKCKIANVISQVKQLTHICQQITTEEVSPSHSPTTIATANSADPVVLMDIISNITLHASTVSAAGNSDQVLANISELCSTMNSSDIKINQKCVELPNKTGPAPSMENANADKKVDKENKGSIPFTSDNSLENLDNDNPEWDLVRLLETDEERYRAVRQCWKSCVIPDPNRDLTYHSYLRQRRFAEGHTHTPPSYLREKRKRTQTLPPSGHRKKQHKYRTASCTQLIDQKITQTQNAYHANKHKIEKGMSEGVRKLEQRYARDNWELHRNHRRQIAMLQCLTPRSRHNSTHRVLNQQNEERFQLEFTHSMEKEEFVRHQQNSLQKVNAQHYATMKDLKAVREEVMKFNSFYSGLSISKDIDPIELDEEQLKELEAIEHMYVLYEQYYGTPPC